MLLVSLRTLLAHLRLTITGVVIAVLAGAAVFFAVPAQKQAEAQLLFVPSVKQPGVTDPTNPLLNLADGLATVARTVQTVMLDDRMVEVLKSKHLTAKYDVQPDLAENAGPILIVTTTSRDGAMAAKTLDGLEGQIDLALENLQARQGVATNLRITTLELTKSDKPTVLWSKQLRWVVLAVGGVVVVFGAAIVFSERRRSRRRVVAGAVASLPLMDDAEPAEATVRRTP